MCSAVVVGGLLVGGGAAAAQGATDPVCAALATAKDAKTKADKAYDEAKTDLTNASSAVVKAEADANAAPNDADLQTELATARALHNQAMTKEASADSTRWGAQMNLNQAVSAAAGKCPPPRHDDNHVEACVRHHLAAAQGNDQQESRSA